MEELIRVDPHMVIGDRPGRVRELHGLMSEIAGGSMCDSLFHLSPIPYIVSNL